MSTSSQFIQSQIDETKDYARSLGFNEFTIIARVGASAKTLSRLYIEMVDELKQTITDNPDIKAVVVYHLNRLARNEIAAFDIKEFLVKHKVQLYVKEPTLCLLNDDGTVNSGMELAFSLFSTLAKQQADELKAKSKRGKNQARSLHKFLGGSQVRFGYEVNGQGYIVPDKHNAEIVKTIYTLYLENGVSTKQVQKEINERYGTTLSRAFIIKVLKQPAYYNGKSCPPIISQELFEQVKNKRENSATTVSSQYLYRRFANRLIKCPVCGGGYTAGDDCYKCTDPTHRPQFNIGWMDGLLWLISSHLEGQRLLQSDTDSEIKQKQAVLAAKIASVDTISKRIEKSRQRAKEMALREYITMDELSARMEELKKEAKDTENNLIRWQEELSALQRKPDTRVLDIAEKISLSDEAQMKDIVRRWVRSVDIDGWTVVVHTLVRDYRIEYRYTQRHKWWLSSGSPLLVQRILRGTDGARLDELKVKSADAMVRTLSWLNGSKIV